MGFNLPLLNRRRRGGTALDIYGVLGLKPALVFDFDDEYYRTGGSTSTFSDAITHSRTSNATMVDSDGLLKWAPHNLVFYSEQFDNGAWAKQRVTVSPDQILSPSGEITADKLISTSVSGEKILSQNVSGGQTLSIYAKAGEISTLTFFAFIGGSRAATFDLSSGSVVSAAGGVVATITPSQDGWYLCEAFYAPGWTGTISFRLPTGTGNDVDGLYIWGAHLYRSDLGGMVNNPDRGDSYVPTTSSARYLARRGHHIWNGSAWVNEGLLHESEARTNLLTYSEDFTDAAWATVNVTPTANASGVTDPAGNQNATELDCSGGATSAIQVLINSGLSGTYTMSCYFKAGTLNFVQLNVPYLTAIQTANFDLVNGIASNVIGTGAEIESAGNGWYRCSLPYDTISQGGIGITPVSSLSDGRRVGAVGTVYAYGAQLEIGNAGAAAPTPSSYMPTSGAQFTRAADTLTVPSANLPWPTPNVIGPELIYSPSTDGSTGTGVATDDGSTVTLVSGDISNRARRYWAFSGLTVGEVYDVRVTPTSISSGTIGLSWSTSSALTTALLAGTSTAAEMRVQVVATATTMYLSVLNAAAGVTNAVISYDNISVREIDPLAVSIQMQGRMTYADEDQIAQVFLVRWFNNSSNKIFTYIKSDGADVGKVFFEQMQSAVSDSVTSAEVYTPGVNVPFNIASRHGSAFINGAVDGTALTANLTPVALPNLSATDLQLGYDYMGTIKLFRIWAADLDDSGIALSSATAPVITGLPTIGVS